MAEYNFSEIESKWQQRWKDDKTFQATVDTSKPKFYALDMFPYPSGAGLHVGHPLGYIATDIVSRYKRNKGFNVLHPMGFDSFGLPAEQYAIQSGKHPADTTKENIARYKEQLKSIGLSFDWDKEIRTSQPEYYKWTQWIFIQLFDSWYNNESNSAQGISTLVAHFKQSGNKGLNAACHEDTPVFDASQWAAFSEKLQQEMLLNYRLAYLSDSFVNWCPELGSVLAHDEVKDGFSERGGHPVVKKKMKQWSLRITAYAERLLQGLDSLDWSDPLKEMQKNWVGKSKGAEITMNIKGHDDIVTVFTTRVDTIYGVTFLVLAPELELVQHITSDQQKSRVDAYIQNVQKKSERDRMANTKEVSGEFTGAFAINSFNGEEIPIWIADYVLAGYGTGAVMAVPSGDQRDFNFAKHFDLPIVPVYSGMDVSEEADPTKEGKIINEGILKGLDYEQATETAIQFLEENACGSGKINYRMRDAIFARQRYWGEPVPVYFKDGMPYTVDVKDLPVILPEIDKFQPTEKGEPPLGRAKDFQYSPSDDNESYPYELSTMPGWAGSSWYWYRYMDAKNDESFVGDENRDYWKNVDLYVGGTEHATGHLLYSRFWNKFLYDLGHTAVEEPFQKLVNQGMIQGRSNFVYRVKGTNQFVSLGLKDEHDCLPMNVDIALVDNDVLDIEAFKAWREDLKDAEFVLEDGKYKCGFEVEKMSKSKFNVVNPDKIVQKYGADTLRMYEMFLGPLEQFKPWNTNGIDGVSKFLKKFWRLFHDQDANFSLSDKAASAEELKILHRTIKKVANDIENLSLNTSVSTLMIATNELTSIKCNKREILEPLLIVLSPFAPHLSEELWSLLGHAESICLAAYPVLDESHLVEKSHEYPVSINGKVRLKLSFDLEMSKQEIEKRTLANETVIKWTKGETPKKVIIVPKRIINIVS